MSKKVKKLSFSTFLIIAVFGVAIILRFYRLNDLLGFWYDQGRDALVIWDMVERGKFTLIGPMMGFTGVFRGAWYYYLIAPFYMFGNGNPIYPSIFLIITSLVALYILYKLGKKMAGFKTGVFALTVASVSYYVVSASRWFSDPTPTLLISVLIVWSLFKFSEKKTWGLPVAGLLAGFAMQFSAAAEIFYVAAILAVVVVFRKKVKVGFKHILLTVLMYTFAFVPQIIFEIRHPGVESSAFYNFVFKENTFTYAFWEIIKTRLPFDYKMFASKFWTNGDLIFAPFFAFFIGLLIFNWKKFWRSDKFKIVFIFSIAPIAGTLFFVSNLGAVYEYYFTGYYLIWILLFSFVYTANTKSLFNKIFASLFIAILLVMNGVSYKDSFFISKDDPKIISYNNQLEAVGWVYKNANNREFNIDAYVPPVIPYAYDYLFLWLGETKYNSQPLTKNVDLLYTLFEIDTNHSERLQAWLARQEGIGEVLKEEKFGGITVQERVRVIK